MTGSDTPESQLAAYALALADAIDAALPVWVATQVERILTAQSIEVDDAIGVAVRAAGDLARAEVGGAVRRLIESDIDDQRTTPLALLRTAVAYPTAILQAAGAQPVPRDGFAARAFPADIYDLSPASFADLDPSVPELGEAGLAWGAAKAFVHRRRHTAGKA